MRPSKVCRGGLELVLRMSRPLPGNTSRYAASLLALEGGPSRRQVVKSSRSLEAPGELLVSSVVGLHDEGAQSTRARVTANVILDGHRVGESEMHGGGGEAIQMPIQKLIATTQGEHTVGIAVDVEYLTHGTGDVLVSPVSLIVSELPSS